MPQFQFTSPIIREAQFIDAPNADIAKEIAPKVWQVTYEDGTEMLFSHSSFIGFYRPVDLPAHDELKKANAWVKEQEKERQLAEAKKREEERKVQAK